MTSACSGSSARARFSFYMKCTGEEAIGVAQAFALAPDDMVFTTYRQQGLLIARDWPILDMMCECYSNSRDRQKGRQLPVLYSSKAAAFFSISGNLGTQFPASGRLGDGLGDQGRPPHRRRLDRRGLDRRARFPPRLDLRLGLSRAVSSSTSSTISGRSPRIRRSPAARRRPSRRVRSASASPACGSTATTSSRSMPRRNGPRRGRAPIMARR